MLASIASELYEIDDTWTLDGSVLRRPGASIVVAPSRRCSFVLGSEVTILGTAGEPGAANVRVWGDDADAADVRRLFELAVSASGHRWPWYGSSIPSTVVPTKPKPGCGSLILTTRCDASVEMQMAADGVVRRLSERLSKWRGRNRA